MMYVNKFRDSLLSKALLIAIAIVLSVAAVFIVNYNIAKTNARSAALKDISVIAESYRGQVCQFMENARQRTEDFASDGLVRTLLQKNIKGKTASSNNLNKHLSESKLVLDSNFKKIQVLSSEGTIVASTDNTEIGWNLSDEPFFQRGKDAVALTERTSRVSGLPEVTISAPVFALHSKKAIGVLVSYVRFSELSKMLSRSCRKEQGSICRNTESWETLDVYLVNRNKFMITDSLFAQNAVLKQVVNTLPVVLGLTMQEEISGFYKGYRDVTVAGVSRRIPSVGWILLAEIDETEILLFTNVLLVSAPAFAGIIFIACILLLIVFFRKVVRPLRQLSGHIEMVSSGHYDISVPVSGRDEIGVLCASFNKMAKDVMDVTTALKKSENSLSQAQRIAGMGNWEWDVVSNQVCWSDEMYRIFGVDRHEFNPTYETVIQCIHPDDREFVIRSVDDTLYRGMPYEVDYRVVHKNATVRNVHAKGEVVYNGSGKAIQMYGTVHDVTEQRRVEEETNLSHSMVMQISAARNLHDALVSTIQGICGVTGMVYGEVWMTDTSGNYLECSTASYTIIKGTEKFGILSRGVKFPIGAGIPGRSAESKKPVWVQDIAQEADCPSATYAGELGLGSCVAFPVLAESEVVAVIVIYRYETARLDDRTISLVSSLLARAGPVIKRKKIEDFLEEQLRLTSLSSDIGIVLGQAGDLRGMLQECADALVKKLDVAFVRFWTLNRETNLLELQCSAGMYTHIDGPHSRIPVGMYKVGLIAQEQKPFMTNTVIGDPRVHEQEWARKMGMIAFAGYPMIIENQVVGVMAMFAQKPISETTFEALKTVANSIAIGMERKQMEECLVKTKNQLEYVMLSSPAMSYSCTPYDFAVTYLSNNVEKLLGYTAEQFIRDPKFWPDHIHPDDKPVVLGFLSHLFEMNHVALEYRFMHRDGTYRQMRDECNLIRDEAGNPREIVGCWTDITQYRGMEEEQKKLREQLYHMQKLESIGTLAGGVAHDFNNILAIIHGYGTMLERSLAKDSPEWLSVAKILKSVERAANLVQGLLTFSRKQGSFQKPVSVNAIIIQTKNFLLRLIGEDIALEVVLTEKDCVVMADSSQIEQILMNLATNARDAMPDGGKLTIRTDVVTLDNKFVHTYGYGENGVYVLISVSDTGMGMDEKTKKRVFEPFFTTKEVGKGTGLGLSIAYGIVKQHRGYIIIESKPGNGATFQVYLPLITATVENGKATPVAVNACGTETILVAEDEEEVRLLVKNYLEEAGYSVIEAANGRDAIAKFEENKDDIGLLLLDVIMPGKNGRAVYEEARKTVPNIKVLFMSGYFENIITVKIILKDGLQFISKPFSQAALLKRVREVLDNAAITV